MEGSCVQPSPKLVKNARLSLTPTDFFGGGGGAEGMKESRLPETSSLSRLEGIFLPKHTEWLLVKHLIDNKQFKQAEVAC